jgi:hypothetical protein
MPDSADQQSSGAVPSPETIMLMRKRYAEGATVREILAATGVDRRVLYYWLDGGPKGPQALPPIPRRSRRVAIKGRARGADGALVARLWRTARRQVSEVERRLARAGQPPAERESDARMLAVLVKTLRELAALDEARADIAKGGRQTRADAEDDRPPQDIDEFRRELARRMDAIAARREARAADEPETG